MQTLDASSWFDKKILRNKTADPNINPAMSFPNCDSPVSGLRLLRLLPVDLSEVGSCVGPGWSDTKQNCWLPVAG